MLGRLIERVVGPLSELISEYIPDTDRRAELLTQFRLSLLSQETELVNASRDVVVAEAQSKSWIARNWRPITMLNFSAILFNNYILAPWLGYAGVEAPVLEIPPEMWTLLTIGIGGYIAGRTIENTGSGMNINIGQNQNDTNLQG